MSKTNDMTDRLTREELSALLDDAVSCRGTGDAGWEEFVDRVIELTGYQPAPAPPPEPQGTTALRDLTGTVIMHTEAPDPPPEPERWDPSQWICNPPGCGWANSPLRKSCRYCGKTREPERTLRGLLEAAEKRVAELEEERNGWQSFAHEKAWKLDEANRQVRELKNELALLRVESRREITSLVRILNASDDRLPLPVGAEEYRGKIQPTHEKVIDAEPHRGSRK